MLALAFPLISALLITVWLIISPRSFGKLVLHRYLNHAHDCTRNGSRKRWSACRPWRAWQPMAFCTRSLTSRIRSRRAARCDPGRYGLADHRPSRAADGVQRPGHRSGAPVAARPVARFPGCVHSASDLRMQVCSTAFLESSTCEAREAYAQHGWQWPVAVLQRSRSAPVTHCPVVFVSFFLFFKASPVRAPLRLAVRWRSRQATLRRRACLLGPLRLGWCWRSSAIAGWLSVRPLSASLTSRALVRCCPSVCDWHPLGPGRVIRQPRIQRYPFKSCPSSRVPMLKAVTPCSLCTII